MSTGLMTTTASPARPPSRDDRSSTAVGMFPGLGSRAAYRNLDRSLLDSGIPAVTEVYRAGAQAMGFGDRHDRLIMVPKNLPQGRLAQQGFIGGAFVVHNLALHAHLNATAALPVAFSAYTGESFGILLAAAASGALEVEHCVALGHIFTPLMLLAAEGPTDEPLAQQLIAYQPDSLRGSRLVPEPAHVVAVRADPSVLTALRADIEDTWGAGDVELHKIYSSRQINLYVHPRVRHDLAAVVAGYAGVELEELKTPTTFLAHSQRMRGVRAALSRYMDAHDIAFRDPHTPVIANAGARLLTTGAEIRDAVLAMTDQIMDSRGTVATVDNLAPDLVVELGLGGRAAELLSDNDVQAPVIAYTGPCAPADQFIQIVGLVGQVRTHLSELDRPDAALTAEHLDTLRALFRVADTSPVGARYVRRTMSRIVLEEMLDRQHTSSSAYYDLLEICQHTTTYRADIDIAAGELVTRARIKKRVQGDPAGLGHAYAELRVLTPADEVVGRLVSDTAAAEVVVLYFDELADLTDAGVARRTAELRKAPGAATVVHEVAQLTARGTAPSPALARVAYQFSAARLLQHQRSALFAQSAHYLQGSGEIGWLTALALSGAARLTDLARYFTDGADTSAAQRLAKVVGDADVPVLAPDGLPLQYSRDLAAVTAAVLPGGPNADGVQRLRLGGSAQILALGSQLHPELIDARPHHTDVIEIVRPADIWRRTNSALDELEERCTLALTTENSHLLRYAQSRRLLTTSVAAYIEAGERVVGFGKGGSESMTIFLRREGDAVVRVRKVLSEALTTVAWDPAGTGVMLPPFEKARKQAEYLLALPHSLRDAFPRVYGVVERQLPVPPHLQRDGKQTYRELIYEMSYVPGEEISRFVEKHTPPPAVVARLYEEVIRVLHEQVHTARRGPRVGDTLETSYFVKIEDRLALCRATAPATFGPRLLDHPQIVIDGVTYRNVHEVMRVLRSRPEFREILEPRAHSLVMGDTNTENIKIDRVGPLLEAQRLIESGAARTQIDAAIAAITAETVGITFLDPRAIGFATDGGATIDDAMYDNKPWHNSIGHYDEIHFEQFDLGVHTGDGQPTRVNIDFWPGNPYQRAYQVRDLAVTGGSVNEADPHGMEDHFGGVMSRIYRLDDPTGSHERDDPYWLIRFVFLMGTHFAAMPPFHFQAELDGTVTDTADTQRRPVAIYCQGVKWLNWALELLEGTRTTFLGIASPTAATGTTHRQEAA